MNINWSETHALIWTGRIISAAIIQQSLEFIFIEKSLDAGGVWNWSTLKKEFQFFPEFFQPILARIFGPSVFPKLLVFNILNACLCLFIPHPLLFFFLWVTQSLICLRWHGSFNGGSDFMTLIVLMGLMASGIFESSQYWLRCCLGYIGLQSLNSYFIAGITKVRKKTWWNGIALRGFIHSCIYKSSLNVRKIKLQYFMLLSWMAIFFELSFPLSVFNPRLCLFFLGIAFTFHLANAFIFGLNRFVLVWVSTYPALIFLSRFLS